MTHRPHEHGLPFAQAVSSEHGCLACSGSGCATCHIAGDIATAALATSSTRPHVFSAHTTENSDHFAKSGNAGDQTVNPVNSRPVDMREVSDRSARLTRGTNIMKTWNEGLRNKERLDCYFEGPTSNNIFNRNYLRTLVTSKAWELTVVSFILVNTVLLGVEVQYMALTKRRGSDVFDGRTHLL